MRLTKFIQRVRPRKCQIDLIRLGGDRDGSYLVPNDLVGIQGCISPGVSNHKLFEDEIDSRFGIPSILIDYSSDPDRFSTPLTANQVFLKKWLHPEIADDNIDLPSVIHKFYPGCADLILQMDIEGAEYCNILNTSKRCLSRFRIICIEFHDLQSLQFPLSNNFLRISKTLARLSSNHICVHAHANNGCSTFVIPGTDFYLPRILECTFIRKDRFAMYSGDRFSIAPTPHPLDIDNVPAEPSLDLGLLLTSDESFVKKVLRQTRFSRIWREIFRFSRDQASKAMPNRL